MPDSNHLSSERELRPLVATALWCGLTAGTLDGLAAIIVYGPVFGRASVSQIFQGIASALFGKTAFQGGLRFTVYGILLHYTIALLFAMAYSLLFKKFSFWQKSWLRSGVLYGIIVWTIMNKLVLPLAGMGGASTISGAATGIIILILCVGIPIALINHQQFQSLKRRKIFYRI